jgi:hypothetical protein
MSPKLPSDFAHDEALLEEIELLTEVIIAATLSPGRLTAEQVDEVLSVPRTARKGLPGQRRAPDEQSTGRLTPQ